MPESSKPLKMSKSDSMSMAILMEVESIALLASQETDGGWGVLL